MLQEWFYFWNINFIFDNTRIFECFIEGHIEDGFFLYIIVWKSGKRHFDTLRFYFYLTFIWRRSRKPKREAILLNMSIHTPTRRRRRLALQHGSRRSADYLSDCFTYLSLFVNQQSYEVLPIFRRFLHSIITAAVLAYFKLICSSLTLKFLSISFGVACVNVSNF